ncbi:hypothetical protein [Nostoc sp. UHCC 0870]|uniref:hypothetical protein n=1 Tax=Nostoc sp. UHCC 0870 TaxID=2914041 RepID=UPI0030DA2FA9
MLAVARRLAGGEKFSPISNPQSRQKRLSKRLRFFRIRCSLSIRDDFQTDENEKSTIGLRVQVFTTRIPLHPFTTKSFVA